MRMLLAQFAFLGVLAASSSGASVVPFDQSASTPVARPIPAVAYAARPRAIRIADVNDQLSHQERAVIAFLSLKAEAERNNR